MVGTPCYFVRTGGCDYRCAWCDSMYAVDPAQVRTNATKMTAVEIALKTDSLPGNPEWIIISGGNPAMHDLAPLVSLYHSPTREMKVAVETQGTMIKPWLYSVDLLTVSPKPPSSGMNRERNFAVLDRLLAGARLAKVPIDLKIVAFDEQDLEYAKTIFRRHPARGDLLRHFLSLGTLVGESTRDDLLDRYDNLVKTVTRDSSLARVTCGLQLHTLVWGHGRGF